MCLIDDLPDNFELGKIRLFKKTEKFQNIKTFFEKWQ